MTDLEGILLFAGIPLAIVALIFAVVFMTSAKPSREPITGPVMDRNADEPPTKPVLPESSDEP
ncbi:hypothetical protein ACGFJ7_00210 [Actinoplanes sp. NPDC048988]